MKKLLIIAIVLLFSGSIAMAANIPVIDPETNPPPVTTMVYAASSLSAGDVVCWASDGSTDDDKNWVDTTCGTDAWHVAGVVWPSAITSGNVGTIAIYGVVNTNLDTGHMVNTGTLLCAADTAAKAEQCADPSMSIGIATEEPSSNTVDAIITVVNVGSSVPNAVDPLNGPEVWTVPVYSNSQILNAGNVVQWCIDDSTGDNDYWVEKTVDAATTIVAGIVWPGTITPGGTGTVAVRGIVTANTATSSWGTISAGDVICTDADDGKVSKCYGANIAYSIGYATSDESSNIVTVYINP